MEPCDRVRPSLRTSGRHRKLDLRACLAQLPTDRPHPFANFSMGSDQTASLVVELNAGELLKHGQPAAPSTGLYRPVLTVTPEELGFGKGIVNEALIDIRRS
jgi:hypothetical protein